MDKLTAILVENVVVRMCEVNFLIGKKLGKGEITEKQATEGIQEGYAILRDLMNKLSE